MINRQFFWSSKENDQREHDNIWKVAKGQEDDCTNGYLVDYVYFKKYYKIIAVDLSKQQTLDTNLKAIQQIKFTGNITQDGDTNKTMLFIIEKLKETKSDLLNGTVKVL